MKVKSENEVAQSCLTPSDPMDCSLPGSSAHEIFQARVLEWGAIAVTWKIRGGFDCPAGFLGLMRRGKFGHGHMENATCRTEIRAM